MDDEYSILEDSVRNTFGSVVWSHKIQEKQADIYFSQYKCMETIKIATASLTSVGIVSFNIYRSNVVESVICINIICISFH